jgi:hypothetical protein
MNIDISNAHCGPGDSIPRATPVRGSVQNRGGATRQSSRAPLTLATRPETVAARTWGLAAVRTRPLKYAASRRPSYQSLRGAARPGPRPARRQIAREGDASPRGRGVPRSRYPRPPSRRRRRSPSGARPRSRRTLRPRIGRDYPLSLSILLSGGKETNKDSPSSCERTGKSPAPNPAGAARRDMWC